MSRVIGPTLLVNLANLSLGVITGVATARGLMPGSRGVFLGVVTWTGTISAFALVGLNDAIVFQARGRTDEAFSLTSRLARGSFRQGLVAFAVLIPINLVVTGIEEPLVALAGSSTGIVIGANIFIQLRMSALRAAERYGLWNTIRIVPQLVHATLISILTFTDKLGVTSGLISLILANAFTAFVAARIYRRVRWTLVEVDVKATTHYGRRLFAANFPMFLSQKTDQLLLAVIAPPALLGVYAVAVTLTGIVQTLGATLEQILFPRLMSGGLKYSDIKTVLLSAVLVSSAAGAVLCVAAHPLIRLVYGSAYVGASVAVLVLMPGVVCVVATQVLGAVLKAKDRLTALLVSYAAGSIIILIILPWLTLRHGLLGAASATTAGYACTLLIQAYAASGSRGMRRRGRSQVQKDLTT